VRGRGRGVGLDGGVILRALKDSSAPSSQRDNGLFRAFLSGPSHETGASVPSMIVLPLQDANRGWFSAAVGMSGRLNPLLDSSHACDLM
jgi:hypothetical protein